MPSTEEIRDIVSRINCLDRRFVLVVDGWNRFLLHVEYEEEDIYTGNRETQKSRNWVVTTEMSESEIVDTAFACIMRSYDHVVKEHFTYKGHRVFSPHFDIEDRISAAKRLEEKEHG